MRVVILVAPCWMQVAAYILRAYAVGCSCQEIVLIRGGELLKGEFVVWRPPTMQPNDVKACKAPCQSDRMCSALCCHRSCSSVFSR